MSTSPYRLERRADRRCANAAPERPEWLETAEAGILYFGITLLPLLVVIVLHRSGLIG